MSAETELEEQDDNNNVAEFRKPEVLEDPFGLASSIGERPELGARDEDGTEITEIYSYYDSQGQETYQKVFSTNEQGERYYHFAHQIHGTNLCMRRRDELQKLEDGTFRPAGTRRPLVLYNNHKISKAKRVIICETERDAQALSKLGFCATTSPEGLERFRSSYVRALDGKICCFVPNNSEESLRRMSKLALRIKSEKIKTKLVEIGYIEIDECVADIIEARVTSDTEKKKLREEIREYLGGCPEWEPRCEDILPDATPARDFTASADAERSYLIPGLLPGGGKMTFSATAKFGKSWFAIEIGLAMASGHCEFLGWKFGEPVRVLYVQSELSDAMIRQRLDLLFEQMPEGIDRERAELNFIVHENKEFVPNLSTEMGRKMIQGIVDRYEPDLLIIDPFANTFPGMIENAAESMGEALRYLADLGHSNMMAILLLHHHSKGGGSRGSSVFEGWPESDLQASFVSDSEKDVAKVSLRLRCAVNNGPLYWRMPREGDLWFAPMPDDYEPGENGGGRKAVTVDPQQVADLCRENPDGLGHGALVERIQEEFGVGQVKAKEAFKAARDAGLIYQDGDRKPWKAAPQDQPSTETK